MVDELDDIVDNLREPSAWIRVIFMVAFAIGLYLIVAPIIVVMAVVQALFALIGGEPNANVRRFGTALTAYVTQILEFLFYNSQEKPFPFSDFPAMEEELGATEADSKPAAAPKTSAAARKKTTAKRKKTAARKAPAKKAPADSGDGPADK